MQPRATLPVALIASGALMRAVGGGTLPEGPATRYQLIEGSTLTSAWNAPATPPDVVLPLRGSFDLRLTNQGPQFTDYAVDNIAWQAVSGTATNHLTGGGTYRIGGELALLQSMTLEVQLDDGQTKLTAVFTNGVAAVDRRWPGLDLSLVQSNTTGVLHYYTLRLSAAPFREIWYSTVAGMTSGNRSSPTNVISAGDLLAFSGRVVKPNVDLIGRLGLMPITPNLPIDAVDVAPGGEILFSLDQDVFSETLGWLGHGDLLSDRGRVVQTHAQLLAAFQPPAGTPDAGLDAVQVLDGGEILFSISTNVFSQALNTTLGRGDLLSSAGRVFKTNRQLLAAFHPGDTNYDYGLDAVYVWPSGEIWFSTEEGFQDSQLGPVSSGDLLSDQGFIVYRNLELVAAFAPLEDLSNFGLDALFIVTDTTPAAPPPQLLKIDLPAPAGYATLSWTGKARVFQLEKASDLSAPFTPASPIIPDLSWPDPLDAATDANAFYRLRAW